MDADKNECKENPGPCDDNATCLNDKNGTYTCSCKEGFLGNGHECQRIGKSVSLIMVIQCLTVIEYHVVACTTYF